MIIREAKKDDWPILKYIRNSVKENKLSDPNRISDQEYIDFLSVRGKGWVAELDGMIRGFVIVDLKENNVWALFVDPDFERLGLGRALQNEMLNWYFDQGETHLWLSTEPGTRAEKFYRNSGWIETGLTPAGEILFERKSPHH